MGGSLWRGGAPTPPSPPPLPQPHNSTKQRTVRPASNVRRVSGAIQWERVLSRPALIASRGLTTTRLPPHPLPPVLTAPAADTALPGKPLRPPPHVSSARRVSGAIQWERVLSRPALIASRGRTTTRPPPHPLPPVSTAVAAATRTPSQRPPPASRARRASGAIQWGRVLSRPVLIASRGLTTTRLPPHPSPPVSTADVAATRTPSQRPPPASTVRLGATPPPSAPPLALAAVAATPPQRSQRQRSMIVFKRL